MAKKKKIDPNKEYSTEEAALAIGLSEPTLNRYRAKGVGPEWCRRGEKLVYYTGAALIAYEKKHRHKTKN